MAEIEGEPARLDIVINEIEFLIGEAYVSDKHAVSLARDSLIINR